MNEKRRILIADPDVETVRLLKKGLSERYEVFAASDGSKALELALLKSPNVILFYRDCPLIAARHFVRIIRTNPRTEDIPLVIISDTPFAGGSLPGYLDGVLVKPLNLDEVLGHLDFVLRRVDAVNEVKQGDGAVRGSLAQISMVDLLQVFAMNRRSGCIRLQRESDGDTAEVFVDEGRIEDAQVGLARGEKALYRLLAWSDGSFSFDPNARTAGSTISKKTDSLLMEGLRQRDELERLLPELPPLDSHVERAIEDEELPDGLHPVTMEILGLLPYYSRVSDLIDRARATDLEACLALKSVLGANVVRRVEADESPEEVEALLSQEETYEVRSRLRRSALPPIFANRPKLALLAASAGELRDFCANLTRIDEFCGVDSAIQSELGVGFVGELKLPQGLFVDVLALASDDAMSPLALSLTAGTVSVIRVGDGGRAMREMSNRMEAERRVRVLSSAAHSGAEDGPTAGVRSVLRAALLDADPGSLRGVAV